MHAEDGSTGAVLVRLFGIFHRNIELSGFCHGKGWEGGTQFNRLRVSSIDRPSYAGLSTARIVKRRYPSI